MAIVTRGSQRFLFKPPQSKMQEPLRAFQIIPPLLPKIINKANQYTMSNEGPIALYSNLVTLCVCCPSTRLKTSGPF